MLSKEELYKIYWDKLRFHLVRLEKRRKIVASNTILCCSLASALIIASIYWGYFVEDPVWCLMSIMLFFPILGMIYGYFSRQYRASFKSKIISELIAYINPDLKYKPKEFLSKIYFNSSGLFDIKPDSYKGDDLVEGCIDGVKIKFSDFNAGIYYSKSKVISFSLFKGLFFMAEFNKDFKGRTYVLPDLVEKSLGEYLARILQRKKTKRGEIVRLENPDFENEFIVYADDQIEARYILSPNLMEKILEFTKATGNRVRFSFVNSRLYLSCKYSKNLFEPSVFSRVDNFDSIYYFYQILVLFISLSQELSLNRKIWTKE